MALLRVGFTEPPWSPRVLVGSYPTVSPLPGSAKTPAVCFLWHCPAGRPGLPLTTTLPCGARTFLGDTPEGADATARPTRPSRVPCYVAMDLTDALLLLGAGVGAGVMNSVAGGGSLITYPALVATGLGSVVANVTNSVAVSAGYVSSAVGTWPEHRALERSQGSVRPLALTAAVGAAAGCALLLLTPAAAFDRVVPFLVLGAVAVLAFQQRLKNVVGHPHELSRRRKLITLHTAVGLSAVYGGYFGAALGIILVALIGLVMDETLIRITALKNSLSVVIGVVTVVVFSLLGKAAGSPVDWASVAVLTPATLVGGYVGARVSRRLNPRVLRAAIVCFGTAVGLVLLWRAFGHS